VLAGHANHVYNVAFTSDGARLVSGDLKGNIRDWDLATGEQLRTLDGAALWKYDPGFGADIGGVRGIDFSPDGKLLACGGITEVTGMMKTFITERPLPQSEGSLAAKSGGKGGKKTGKVTVDDAAAFLARFENGAIGTFESSRFAVGRKNAQRFEINGSKGSIVFELERLNELQFYNNADAAGRHGFRLIQATDPGHPYIANYWPPGHIIGWEHTFINAVADVINGIVARTPVHPTFADGLATQKVLDAVEQSAQSGAWVKV
jgi:hypothetical protein